MQRTGLGIRTKDVPRTGTGTRNRPTPFVFTKIEDKEMNNQETLTKNKIEQPEIFETEIDRNNVFNFTATLKELRNNVEPEMVRHRSGWRDREGKMRTIGYIEWHSVADVLDRTAPNWGHSVKDIRTVGEFVIVTVAITIDGVTREGIGTGSARSEMGIKKAEHDALKRAAVKFGIARDLYKRETDEPAAAGDDAASTEPVARSIAELITTKQLAMIRAIARERGVDADEICKQQMKCRVSELSRRAASSLIDRLQSEPTAVPFKKAG